MKHTVQKNGFTLVEIMVATSIFMIIMLVAMGALISTSDTAKKAQALRSAMDNVNFAMESMSRSLRIGSDYTCLPTGFTELMTLPLDPQTEPNCTGSGGSGIAFTPAKHATHRDTVYTLNSGVLQSCTGVKCLNLTASNVNIEMMKFYVNGAKLADQAQPSVNIIMKGTVMIKGVPNTFALQTMASQRSSE